MRSDRCRHPEYPLSLHVHFQKKALYLQQRCILCVFIIKPRTTLQQEVKKSDWMGMAASVACLIHCSAAPLLFLLQPLLAGAAVAEHHHHHEQSLWHYVFFALALLAVWYSSRSSDSRGIRLGLWTSLTAFGIGIFFEAEHNIFSDVLLYGGSVGLVVAHYLNMRSARSCAV